MTDWSKLIAEARAATPGPWELGHVYGWAGVTESQFGRGRCAYCALNGEPVLVKQRHINGTVMLAHMHRHPEPYRPTTSVMGPAGELVVDDSEDAPFIARYDPSAVGKLLLLCQAVENELHHRTSGSAPVTLAGVRDEMYAALNAVKEALR